MKSKNTHISTFGSLYLLKALIFDFRIFISIIKYTYVVFFDFFMPQFFKGKTTVVNVDHPLDSTIEFMPHYVKKYLSFVKLWITTLSYIVYKIGRASFIDVNEFLKGLIFAYRESAYVYKKCKSTMIRPNYKKGLQFKVIHYTDPHLHCIPSLHVIVVVYNYIMGKKILEKFSDKKSVQKDAVKWLYQQAVIITDTILYVKQHSINCISTSLFFMTVNYPDFFGKKDVYGFIEDLFSFTESKIKKEKEIKNHIRKLYDSFIKKYSKNQIDYKEILLEFLQNYDVKNPPAFLK